ncbi:MAG: TetR/AcrR family transcriptional regulator [Nakamurella sp.]
MTEQQPPDLPRYVQLLWGISTPGRRGPKPGLTIQQIGDAAVVIADAEGLAGVSMKAVAGSLGLTTMSLYRYLDSKDELFAVMVDCAYGAPRFDLFTAGDWRQRLETWARVVAKSLLGHPWILDVRLTPSMTPNAIGWMEAGARSFSQTPLPEQQKMSALLLVDGFVRNHLRTVVQFGLLEPAEQPIGYDKFLAAVMDPARFPALTAAQVVFADDDEDFYSTEFEFGLKVVLGGIEQLINKH